MYVNVELCVQIVSVYLSFISIPVLTNDLLQVFCKDLARDKLWEIMEKVMAAYDDEPETRDN